ncbi:hypothetical protein FRC17_004802 [Serendipita sp. 399]|nr:hypothetical protein FRC17_004802 [Serendipita sp. 399]
MPSPVPYSRFITQNGASVTQDGPWTVTKSSSEIECRSALEPSYNIKFEVNVSIPANLIGNSNTITYDWTYNAAFGSGVKPRGTSLSISSYVGYNSYVDSIPSDDLDELIATRQTWINSPFSHSGSTSVVQYGDPTTGYVSIIIDFSFSRELNSDVDYFMKGASFRLTNGPASTTSISTTTSTTHTSSHLSLNSSSISSAGNSARSSSQIASGTPIISVGGDGQTYSIVGGVTVGHSSYSDSATSKRIPTIVGAVIGAALILSTLLFFWFRARRKRYQQRIGSSPSLGYNRSLVSPWTKQRSEVEADKAPRFTNPRLSIEPMDNTNLAMTTITAQPDTQDDRHANEPRPLSVMLTVFTTDAPPPAYASAHSPTQFSHNSLMFSNEPRAGDADDSALSLWAQENRTYITARLEAKLVAAGYSPSTDPDLVTEEQWEERWGVTKLELTRMRMLYARSQG